jgi:hypothetical protein
VWCRCRWSRRGEGSVNAVTVQEGLRVAVAVVVIPDDLARIVDGEGSDAWPADRRGIVGEVGVGAVAAAAVKEALPTAACDVIPDDLAQIVDATGNGAYAAALIG